MTAPEDRPRPATAHHSTPADRHDRDHELEPYVAGCPRHGGPDRAPVAWDGCPCPDDSWLVHPAPGIGVVLPAETSLDELLHAADTVSDDPTWYDAW